MLMVLSTGTTKGYRYSIGYYDKEKKHSIRASKQIASHDHALFALVL